MERFFLVIGAGLLSVSAAYAQIPHCSVQCSDVSNLVCSLPANYDPTGTTPLACDPLNPVSPTYVTKINDAFKAGNGTVAGLQKCLCSLKNILVHNNITYGGWGKWENPNRSRASKKGRSRSDDSFIALHVNDLNTTVKDQQDAHLRALNIPVSVAYHTETNGSAIDSATLAILYALAHEMGHMTLRRDFTSYDPKCSLFNIMSRSWSDPQNWVAYVKRPWTSFGETDFGNRDKSINPNAVPNPVGATASTLQVIYQSNVTTALGAANPEEDFVESYAVEAINLAASNQFALSIVINNGTPFPVNTINRDTDIGFKFGCADKLLK